MKNILVPTDFSPTAQAALDLAVIITKSVNGRLTLLHVIEEASEGSFNVEGQVASDANWVNKLFTMKMIETSRKRLARLSEQLNNKGIDFKTVLRLGDPFHGIETVIADQRCDLIVMGTKGSSGFKEVVIGSLTEKVVRRASCPVLSISTRKSKGEFKSIAFATGLREDESAVLDVVKNTQAMYGSAIHIVRVNTPGLFAQDFEVMKRMTALAKASGLKNYTLNTYNDISEEDGITRFAESINADLIIMATHARTALGHLLSGSVAEKVVNHSSIPVLTYRVGAKTKRRKSLPANYNL